MFMKDTVSGDLIRIVDVEALHDPFKNTVTGCDQVGEEEQEPKEFAKDRLVFPSGEALPQCWHDPSYQVHRARVH